MLRYDEISRTLQWDEHLFELLNPENPEYYEEVFPEGSGTAPARPAASWPGA